MSNSDVCSRREEQASSIARPEEQCHVGSAGAAPAKNHGEARHLRILVLDDDPARGRVFLRCFAGHDVDVVTSGQEAIDACWAKPYDVLCVGDAFETETAAKYIAAVMPAWRRPRRALIHTWNGPASIRMAQVLREAGVITVRYEFSALWTAETLRCLLPEGE